MEPDRHISAYTRLEPPERREPRRNGRRETRGRPLGELLRELGAQTQALIRLELRLAKTELSEKVAELGKGAGLIVGGGLVAYAGFIAIVMALGFLLGSFMPDWLGFLCAGLLVALVGGAVLSMGMKRMEETEVSLDKTAESIQEDKEWIREEAADVKKDPAHLGSHQ